MASDARPFRYFFLVPFFLAPISASMLSVEGQRGKEEGRKEGRQEGGKEGRREG